MAWANWVGRGVRKNWANLHNPEQLVWMLMQEDFYCKREKRMKLFTRYRLAKETGLSWPTINRIAKGCGMNYRKKTKKALRALVTV